MPLPTNFNPYIPVPNGPFYSPQTNALSSLAGMLVVGAGLTIDFLTSTISATGGGGGSGTVTSVATGTGLTGGPITTTGTISLANTTVTPGSYTNANITVNDQGRITLATNGTPGGVASVTVTAPITNTGSATVPNIGLADTVVVPGSYTYSSLTVDAKGRLTAASSGTAPVTTVTGTSPIVSSGGLTPAISLANTAVTPGSYTYGTFTVDSQGRLTAASDSTAPNTTVTTPITNSGTAIAPVIGIQDATTGQKGAVQIGTNIDVIAGVVSIKNSTTAQQGIVQLNDTVASTSTTQALTANQGKALQDQISTLLVAGSLVLAGTLNASTGNLATVTSDGTAASFVVGSPIPSPAVNPSPPGNVDYFVIVTTAAASYTPPGGSAILNVSQGDWVLSDGVSWQYLNVGYDAPPASTTTEGVVRLATTLETQTGTSSTIATTPAGGEATYIRKSALTAAGDLLYATGANVPAALPIGTVGQALLVSAGNLPVWSTIYQCLGTVTSVATGTGLTGGPVTSTGTIALDNTAVTPGSYTYGSFTVDAQGRLTAASNGTALVTAVTGTAPIVSSGGATPAISLANTAVTAGTYTNANITVDAQGRLTAASNGFVAGAATPVGQGLIKGCTLNVICNTFLGCQAGLAAPTGANNTLVGHNAGCAVTTGFENTSIGSFSSSANTTGSNNTALGFQANASNTTGSFNVALGWCALAGAAGATPDASIAIGSGALKSVTTGDGNIAVGAYAFCALTTGSFNTLIGSLSGAALTTGSFNFIGGHDAGLGLQNGVSNVFVGGASGRCVTSGSDNTFVGDSAGVRVTTGCYNVALGVDALRGSGDITTCGAVAIGSGALENTCSTGASNTVAIGRYAGANVTTGGNLTLVGANAGRCLTTAFSNTFVGYQAGFFTTGNNNTLLGLAAGCNLTTGSSNVAIGELAGAQMGAAGGNVMIGNSAGRVTTQGSNTFVGCNSGCSNTNGYFNTFYGWNSGTTTTTGTCNVVIGVGASTSTASVSNEVTISNSIVAARFSGTGPWSFISDARDKTDVEDLVIGLDFIKAIQPRKFKWNLRSNEVGKGKEAAGFIAQEVLEVAKQFDAQYTDLVYTNDPEQYTFAATNMIPMMVNAIKELAAEVESLKAQLNSQN